VSSGSSTTHSVWADRARFATSAASRSRAIFEEIEADLFAHLGDGLRGHESPAGADVPEAVDLEVVGTRDGPEDARVRLEARMLAAVAGRGQSLRD
jgi:hypothetical protein